MWQRKQTLYLALATLLGGMMYLFPLARYEKLGVDGAVLLTLSGLHHDDGTPWAQDLAIPLPWLMALLLSLLLVSIGLFKQRARQRRMVRLSFLFTLGMVVGLAFTHNAITSGMGTVGTVTSHILPPFYLPFAMLVLIWLAERGIRKDEELLKSAERLR